MDVFGPVQSRRLGLSLGINHLPPKTCTYSCVYCQLGRTSFMTTNRSAFSDPQKVFNEIKNRVDELSTQDIHIDTITFVSNGEPTLDKSLGEAIHLVKPLGIQTAVITNASLLWHPDTRKQLMEADVVSLKVDSVIEKTWHKIARPHGTLKPDTVFNGIHWFAQEYTGKLLTETMLLDRVNDTEKEAKAAAIFIADLNPHTAYIALPLRPPAEEWVKPSSPDNLTRVYHIFKEKIKNVEILMDLPDSELPASEDPVESLLATLQVHPLSRAEVEKHLTKHKIENSMLDQLVEDGSVNAFQFLEKEFFVRNYAKKKRKK